MRDQGNHTAEASIPLCDIQMQRLPEVRFTAMLGKEPEVDLALV